MRNFVSVHELSMLISDISPYHNHCEQVTDEGAVFELCAQLE